MDALVERSPRITRELKEASRLATPAQRYEFDPAMVELQMKLYIVKVAELYEPFAFVWDLVVRPFAAEVERARDIEPQQALTKLLEKYFTTVLVSSPTHIARLFDWEPYDIRQALAELHAQGKVVVVDIEGESRRWRLSASWRACKA